MYLKVNKTYKHPQLTVTHCLSTFYAFIVKCHAMILSKRHLFKNQLYFGLFKNLLKAVIFKEALFLGAKKEKIFSGFC